MTKLYPKFYLALGEDSKNTFFVKDSSGNWQEFKHYEYFRINRRLNQVSSFELKIYDIQDSQKEYFKERAEIMFFSGLNLILKGRIEKIEYSTGYECVAEGSGMEAQLYERELTKESNTSAEWSDVKRGQWINVSAQTIAKELLSVNTDGSPPWIMEYNNDGLFQTDYGSVNVRFENSNRLKALAKLCEAIDYEWWVSTDKGYNHKFNIAPYRGSQTSVKTYSVTGVNANAVKTSQKKDITQLANHLTFVGYGDGINQLRTSVYSASSSYTTLASDITNSETEINLVDASNFPSSGTIKIMEEQITYSGKTGNTLTGCSRGANSTIAYSHKKGVYVEEYHSYSNPEEESSIYKNGLKEHTIVDKSITDRETAELIASRYLLDHLNPIIQIKVKPIEPLKDVGEVNIGDKISITDTESGLDGEYRVVGIEYKSEYGFLDMEIEVSNRSLEFIEQMQKEKEQNENLSKYMQGATNIYAISEAENCDSSHYLNMRFFVPNDAVAINSVKLNFKLKDYRAYNTGASSGGGSTQTSSGGSAHSHNIVINSEPSGTLGASAVTISGNTLYAAQGTGGTKTSSSETAHTHTVTIPSHTHNINYGIYEQALSSPSVDLYIGEDGGSMLLKGTYTSDKTELDITDEVSNVGAGKWINLQFRPNKNMRIEANAYVKIFIESK